MCTVKRRSLLYLLAGGRVRETSKEAAMARSDLTPFRLGDLMERRWGGDPFMSMYRDMSRLMEDAFRGLPLASSAGMAATPRMDIRECQDEICIETDLPGVSGKDLEVRLDDDVLTIRGERQSQRRDGDGENYHVMERSMGVFERSMRLPFQVDPGQVKANFDNGVLTIVLPKSAQQQISRRIEVRSGSPAAHGVAGEPRSFAHSGSEEGEGTRGSGAESQRRKTESSAHAAAE
jgi:HSP20 family protein